MLPEIAPAITNAALAVGLLASTVFISNPSARISALSYEEPLFTCNEGTELYKKINQNNSINSAQKKELIATLVKEMPSSCSKLTSKSL